MPARLTTENLIDIEEIKQLRNLYCHYYDGCEIDKLAELFCEDGVCEFPEQFGGSWVGRDAIRENFNKQSHQPPHSVTHAVTNPWIRLVSETRANGRWYLLDLRTTEGAENPLILFGIYDDIYHKVDGEWLIFKTRIDFLWPNRNYFGHRTPEELA